MTPHGEVSLTLQYGDRKLVVRSQVKRSPMRKGVRALADALPAMYLELIKILERIDDAAGPTKDRR